MFTLIFYEQATIPAMIIIEGDLHYSIARTLIPICSKYKGTKKVKKIQANLGVQFTNDMFSKLKSPA